MPEIHALIVEDSDTDATIICAHLRSSGLFQVVHVQSLDAAYVTLNSTAIDVVVLDLNLPDSSGIVTFETLRKQFSDLAIVILSGQEDEQLAIDAVAKGAQDYFPKGMMDRQNLVRSLRYAVERQGRTMAERRNLAIENDLNAARRIQQQMLPIEPPAIAGFDIAGKCQPTEECGGDFYDFIPRDDGTWDLIVADVSSHGFGSAMIMVGARWLLRSCAKIYQEVGEILTFANRAVAEDTFDEHFITLFYARLDPVHRRFTHSAAGHPVWIVTADGQVRELPCDGFPLGIVPENHYDTCKFTSLDHGDILVMATDGCYEAMSPVGEMLGQKKFFNMIIQHRHESCEAIRDHVLGEIADFCLPATPHDDYTLVLVKVTG